MRCTVHVGAPVPEEGAVVMAFVSMLVVQLWREAYGAAIDDGHAVPPRLPLRRQTPGNAAHGADRLVVGRSLPDGAPTWPGGGRQAGWVERPRRRTDGAADRD